MNGEDKTLNYYLIKFYTKIIFASALQILSI